jgi:putative oxidoreductase
MTTDSNPRSYSPSRHSLSKGANIACWLLQILAALAFLAAGGSKLAGAPAMVDIFAHLGVGQWFRYLTGALEITGAVGLLIPGAAFYGAALLATVMVGAIAAHLAILGGSPTPAIVLLLVTGSIAYLRRTRSR